MWVPSRCSSGAQHKDPTYLISDMYKCMKSCCTCVIIPSVSAFSLMYTSHCLHPFSPNWKGNTPLNQKKKQWKDQCGCGLNEAFRNYWLLLFFFCVYLKKKKNSFVNFTFNDFVSAWMTLNVSYRTLVSNVLLIGLSLLL